MARTLLWLALILCAFLTVTTCTGLRLELTHVDAKEGFPLAKRLRCTTERTHRRLASMAAAGVTLPVHWAGTNQYIAEYLIGDPPQRAEAIIDTAKQSHMDTSRRGGGRWAGTFIDSGMPFTKLVDVAHQALRAELVHMTSKSMIPDCSARNFGDILQSRSDLLILSPPYPLPLIFSNSGEVRVPGCWGAILIPGLRGGFGGGRPARRWPAAVTPPAGRCRMAVGPALAAGVCDDGGGGGGSGWRGGRRRRARASPELPPCRQRPARSSGQALARRRRRGGGGRGGGREGGGGGWGGREEREEERRWD
nr:unnamed protein product [Digitaria exilis]